MRIFAFESFECIDQQLTVLSEKKNCEYIWTYVCTYKHAREFNPFQFWDCRNWECESHAWFVIRYNLLKANKYRNFGVYTHPTFRRLSNLGFITLQEDWNQKSSFGCTLLGVFLNFKYLNALCFGEPLVNHGTNTISNVNKWLERKKNVNIPRFSFKLCIVVYSFPMNVLLDTTTYEIIIQHVRWR